MGAPRTSPAIFACLLGPALMGEDCNRNGIDDALDLELRSSPDCNANDWPDECDVEPAEGILVLAGTLSECGVLPRDVSLAAGDFDADGDLDCVAACTSGSTILNRNQGSLAWTEERSTFSGPPIRPPKTRQSPWAAGRRPAAARKVRCQNDLQKTRSPPRGHPTAPPSGRFLSHM